MERKFKGVWVPASIWLDDNLSPVEKLILAEIDSLDNDANGCIATNEYLAKFAQLSVRTTASILAKLNKNGYIYITNGGNKMRAIKINRAKNAEISIGQPCKICTVEQPTVQILHAINIVSKKEIKKRDNYQAHAHEIESYNSILDNLDVHGIYRLSVFEFIKHLNLNGHKVINSRLESLIIALDRRYPQDDVSKCVEIKTAITNGYVRLPSEEIYNYN